VRVLFNELAVDAEAGLGARLYFAVLGLNLISGEPLARFPQEQAYIQSWLKALKNDNKMIVWAAKKAEEAAIYIWRFFVGRIDFVLS
jgi:antirestriction protein ArdC